MNRETKRIIIQVALFIVTFISTTFAGVEWAYGKSVFTFSDAGEVILNPEYTMLDFSKGLAFSIPLLLILTVHEFGHYFVALYHKVKTSLPYYIPIPPIPYLPFSIGTMGAVIRLRSRPVSNLQNFDIGLAGPLAGFIAALIIMAYGFITLPEADYVFQFHPEYKQYGQNYADVVYTEEYMTTQKGVVDVQIGTNLIFWLFGEIFGEPSRVPNAHEIMHYPTLFACYIALFVTCLNLLPIGQLDGGHVVYGLFGFRMHKVIATIFFLALVFYSGLGLPFIDLRDPQMDWQSMSMGIAGYGLFLFISFHGLKLSTWYTFIAAMTMLTIHVLLAWTMPELKGYEGWLLFGLMLGRLIGVEHPRSEIEEPLDSRRVILGWLTLLIFVLCFSPAPISIIIPSAAP